MNNCENCKFYIQHYGFDKQVGIFKIEYGHCLECKKLKSNCEKFIANTSDLEKIEQYNALKSLIKIEIILDEIHKEIQHIKLDLKQ